MSDLVERLREMYENWGLGSKGPAILKESADRITTLEAELQKAREAALEEAAKVAHDALSNTSGFVSNVRRERVTTAIRALSQDKEAREAAPVDNVNSGDGG